MKSWRVSSLIIKVLIFNRRFYVLVAVYQYKKQKTGRTKSQKKKRENDQLTWINTSSKYITQDDEERKLVTATTYEESCMQNVKGKEEKKAEHK